MMMTLLQSKWIPGLVTALVMAAAAGTATQWGLRLFAGRRLQEPARAPVVDAAVLINPADVARVLGSKSEPAVEQASIASRFALMGVVAGSPNGGAALISVDGKPAQPVRVGGTVANNFVLQSVLGRTAKLGVEGRGVALVSLEMPTLETSRGADSRGFDRRDAVQPPPEMAPLTRRNNPVDDDRGDAPRSAPGMQTLKN